MALDVDWSSIQHLCWAHSVALEKNDKLDRPAFDDEGPVTHKDMCWLGKNYADQPDKRALGCDQGCIKEAAMKRWARRMLVAELQERKKH